MLYIACWPCYRLYSIDGFISVHSPSKADFIRAKHQMLSFIIQQSWADDSKPPTAESNEEVVCIRMEEEASQELHSSVRTANLETSLRLLSQGANPNYFHKVSSDGSVRSLCIIWRAINQHSSLSTNNSVRFYVFIRVSHLLGFVV